MIVATALTVLGLVMGIGLVQFYGLRLSGVVVVPLFAVYVLYDFLALPVFFLGAGASYAGLSILQRRTLLFGRHLLLASMGIGMAVPLVVLGVLKMLDVPGITLTEVTFFGSILPGVAGYNYHQLELDQRYDDVLFSGIALHSLAVLGAAWISITFAPHIGRLTPSFLYGPNSDIAVLRNAVVRDTWTTLEFPWWLILVAILLGLIYAEGAYQRWGIRLNGIIAIPLLAIFALHSVLIVPLYVVGVTLVYGAIALVHRATLLYGRVLLALGLAIALVGMIPIGMVAPVTNGLHLFFTAILVGIGAYNLHRIPPVHRSTSIALSAGAFVVLLCGLRLLVPPAPAGALARTDPTLTGIVATPEPVSASSIATTEHELAAALAGTLPVQIGLMAIAFAVGAVAVFQLEQRRVSSVDRRRIRRHEHT